MSEPAFGPIVCGVDFTEPAREGMFAAAALAACAGRRLVLVHALERSLLRAGRGEAQQLSDAHARLVEESDRILLGAKVLTDHQVIAGEAPAALAGSAEKVGASLLVVGSPGHGGALLFGPTSVSERLAATSYLPLLVVRQADPFVRWASGDRPLRIVIGVDDTPASRAALHWLEDLRRIRACDAVVAHIFDALEPLPEEPTNLVARVGALQGTGAVEYRPHPGLGRIADDLLRVAEAEAADLLVIGSHRRRGLAKLWSVAAGAVHLARMAVACIPEPRPAR